MAKVDVVMPKMGESVLEATISEWCKKIGDTINEDEDLLVIETDKVDGEIPSTVTGVIQELLFNVGDVVPIGAVIARVESSTEAAATSVKETVPTSIEQKDDAKTSTLVTGSELKKELASSNRFYSPLVKNIANKEHVTAVELEQIPGSGRNNRVRKQDVLSYIDTRSKPSPNETVEQTKPRSPSIVKVPSLKINEGDTIVEMDRIRKIIAESMVRSKQVSPHVTSFIETDVTELVQWRNKIKDDFEKREKQKLTYMPIFIEAVAKALKEYPGINASVDDDKIIFRKNINIGVAVALPTGNLIVPVIKNADQKNLLGLAVDLNTLASLARNNKLKADDVYGGTFTISNFGTFKNLTGTPIINQPEVAILAVGSIEKKPAVIETPSGDVIAVRHKMILALSYDHRIVDGALGGAFLKAVSDHIQNFDTNRAV